ncbi:hypothetical protein ABIB14_001541 [Arthrobacter sp. UYEF3]
MNSAREGALVDKSVAADRPVLAVKADGAHV